MPGVYDRKDRYYARAKEEGFASRAVYKFEQLDQKFKLLHSVKTVLDIGCSPGSWLQFISTHLTKKHADDRLIIGVDLLPLAISLPQNARFIQGDVTEPSTHEAISSHLTERGVTHVDLLVSDGSPNLSGILFADQARSLELNAMVIEVARRFLKPSGQLVLKSFEGESIPELKKILQESFTQITRYIPDATRKTSREVYWVARKKM